MRFVHTASRALPRWWLAFLMLGLSAIGSVRAADDDYPALLAKANGLLKDGKLDDAFKAANAAIALDDKRFEAYFLAGVVARQQGRDNLAKTFLATALDLAPEGKKAKIQQFMAVSVVTAVPTTAPPATTPPAPPLAPEAQRKLDILMVIIQDADSADSPDKRKELLGEFLEKSAPFLKEHPGQANIWVLRAVAAVELERERSAKRAGQKLQELGYGNSQDEKIRKVMAMLDRKGWLIPPTPPVAKTGEWPESGKPFENTLGMKFVPVPGTGVLFSIWDTRVQDYQAFVQATSTEWPDPGFPQGPTHPAVNVSWLNAKKFCEWLTEKEQQAGRLGPDQEYRLATDAEWSVAVGLPAESGSAPAENDTNIPGVYPWGTQWPPPNGSGNYADVTYYNKFRDKIGHSDNQYIKNYIDGFSETSPVGSFQANRFAIFDIDGNVWQWCEDWHDQKHSARVIRGASFKSNAGAIMIGSYRSFLDPVAEADDCGFRLVIVPEENSDGANGLNNIPYHERELAQDFIKYLMSMNWASGPRTVCFKSPTEFEVQQSTFGITSTAGHFTINEIHPASATSGTLVGYWAGNIQQGNQVVTVGESGLRLFTYNYLAKLR
jgi:hypothetical protein